MKIWPSNFRLPTLSCQRSLWMPLRSACFIFNSHWCRYPEGLGFRIEHSNLIMKLIKDKKTDSNFLFTFFEMRLMQSLSTKKQICQKVSSDCLRRKDSGEVVTRGQKREKVLAKKGWKFWDKKEDDNSGASHGEGDHSAWHPGTLHSGLTTNHMMQNMSMRWVKPLNRVCVFATKLCVLCKHGKNVD